MSFQEQKKNSPDKMNMQLPKTPVMPTPEVKKKRFPKENSESETNESAQEAGTVRTHCKGKRQTLKNADHET